MRQITGIIIHAAATRPNWMAGQSTAAKVAEIRRWHVEDNGWADIGYHYLIDRDGTTLQGRSIDRDGAHVRGHNAGTIGICLFGGHGSSENDDFPEHFTEEQDEALRELLAQLQEDYGPVPVTGHNEYAAKACPGFQVAAWLAAEPLADAPQPVPATDELAALRADRDRLRWRIASMRDLAIRALEGN